MGQRLGSLALAVVRTVRQSSVPVPTLAECPWVSRWSNSRDWCFNSPESVDAYLTNVGRHGPPRSFGLRLW